MIAAAKSGKVLGGGAAKAAVGATKACAPFATSNRIALSDGAHIKCAHCLVYIPF